MFYIIQIIGILLISTILYYLVSNNLNIREFIYNEFEGVEGAGVLVLLILFWPWALMSLAGITFLLLIFKFTIIGIEFIQKYFIKLKRTK